MEHGSVVVCEGDTYTVLQAVPHTVARGNARGPAGAYKVTLAPAAGGPSRVVITAPSSMTWVDSTTVSMAAPCETCAAPLGRPCTGNVCLPRVPFNPAPATTPATREQAHA